MTNEFHNLLDPAIELYNPAGALVASDDNSEPDGVNAGIVYTATNTGIHRVRLVGVTNSYGEYVLGVDHIVRYPLVVASAHGTPIPPAGTNYFDQGTQLTSTVTSPDNQGATQYVCTGWTGTGSVPTQGTGTNVTFTITNDSSIVWQWVTNYWLATAASGPGEVDVASQWCALGTNVEVTATPSNHWHFTAWSGDTNGCAIAGNRITAQMDRPRAISAGFSANMATNNTPHWWLAQYGLPTNDTGALYDDGDGMPAWQEYVADTDPTNKESVLLLIGITSETNGIRLDWKGGEWATQYVQTRMDLGSTGNMWISIYTNAILPTPITNYVIDPGATNTLLFYRIKVVR